MRPILALALLLPATARAADRQPPAWPQDAFLSAGADQVLHDRPPGVEEAMNGGHVHLEWPAATDDVRVTRYRIFRDGRRVADVKGGVLAWDRREKRAKGRWSVRAGDAAGNWSAPLAADVRSPYEVMLDFERGGGGAIFSSGDEPKRGRNIRVRVGRRGDAAFFEKSLDYRGEKPLAFPAGDVEIRITPRDDDTWRMTVHRGGDEISTTIVNHPLSPESGGSCSLDTDYEHTGGLWIELGIAGFEWSAAQACAQATGPR